MTPIITLLERELRKHNAEISYTQLKKGDKFVYSGQVSRHVALVKTGFLRAFHINEKGDELTTEFSQPGNFCGSYYSFFTEKPAFEYIEAMTDCELQLIGYQLLQKLYLDNFDMNMLGRKLLEQAIIERDLRLKKILHLSAKERFEWFTGSYPEVAKVAKPQYVASFLGMSVESLGRLRRHLLPDPK
jgi:CRP-like cAMP-binding protein